MFQCFSWKAIHFLLIVDLFFYSSLAFDNYLRMFIVSYRCAPLWPSSVIANVFLARPTFDTVLSFVVSNFYLFVWWLIGFIFGVLGVYFWSLWEPKGRQNDIKNRCKKWRRQKGGSKEARAPYGAGRGPGVGTGQREHLIDFGSNFSLILDNFWIYFSHICDS